MGSSFSHLCFHPPDHHSKHQQHHHHHHHHPDDDVIFTSEDHLPLDETLGHSFCYVSSSSSRFLSPTHSLRLDPDPAPIFRTISGASVSANSSVPTSSLLLNKPDDPIITNNSGFDCTASFAALPLQPVPRESNGFFLSGPLDPGSESGRVPFSAPLGQPEKKGRGRRGRKKKGLGGMRRSLSRSFSEKKRPWVFPVSMGRKENGGPDVAADVAEVVMRGGKSEENVQWALGKAGEDRVHVVVSEQHGWVFVGIYDGFNGPDAPEFLMGSLYRAVFDHLKGLFWDEEDGGEENQVNGTSTSCTANVNNGGGSEECGSVKRVTFQSDVIKGSSTRRKLWEFLAENDPEDGLDLSGSERFAFSVDDAVSVVGNAGSAGSRRSLLLSKLKQGLSRTRDGHGQGHSRRLFQWRFGVQEKEDKVDEENRNEERAGCRGGRRRKTGPVDHELVLRALARALEKTENAYLDLTEKVLDRYPELALMGSCLLVVLMRDEDVYVMNLGDSRAIVAQLEPEEESCSNGVLKEVTGSCTEGIVEESVASCDEKPTNDNADEFVGRTMKLTALQLSTDHSTNIEEEVLRIKREHPDDSQCIVNDRVKGRLKVTRAFGAGFLKQPKFNDSLFERFRNEFIGNAPYVSCIPSLRHHTLGPRDQFLVLSSDGLYQYFSNEEVVSFVENFLERFPDGDPAQHLIEELLNRAAKKAGLDFHDLLEIRQGERRKYHDDVTVMVISLEGRIWKSSGKYP